MQLRARFQRNPIEAEVEADRCKFVFGQEHRMDLRTYVTRKQNLLLEAGIDDPRMIMNRLWRDIDPILQMNVTPDPHMPLESFIQALYFQEYAARRLWQQMSLYSRPNGQGREQYKGNRQPYENTYQPVAPRQAGYQGYQPYRPIQPPSPAKQNRLIANDTNEDRAARPLPDTIRGRPRYPCTICQSKDHLDNACPQRQQKGAFRTSPKTGIRVHFADEDNDQKENQPEPQVDDHEEHEERDYDEFGLREEGFQVNI